jgi:hypothetical protein
VSWQLVFAIASILLGLLLIVNAYMPRPSPAPATRGQLLAHARRELGLAHRLLARLVGVPRLGLEDRGFAAVAELSLLSRPALAFASRGRASGVIELAASVLEVEQLLERMESFSGRMRRLLPRGRARGKA